MSLHYRGHELHACSTSLGWFASWLDARGERHSTANVDDPDTALEMARNQVDEAIDLDGEPATPRD